MNSTNNPSMVLQCVRFPPRVNSLGWYGYPASEQVSAKPFLYSLPSLELQIVLIFLITHLIHLPLKRLAIPKLVSEICAGLILGSSGFGRYRKFQNALFPVASQAILGGLTSLGYILFLFLSGVRLDIGVIRETGKKAWIIGVLNLVVPLTFGAIITIALRSYYTENGARPLNQLCLLVVTVSITSFPVVCSLLKDLKILNSDIGRLAMSSSLISDLIGIALQSLSILVRIYYMNARRALEDIGLITAFLVILIFLIRPALIWVVKQTPEDRPVGDGYIYIIILVVFLSGVFSDWFEMLVIFGPFYIGLATPEGPPLGSSLVDKLDTLSSGLLLPTFVTLISLRTNLFAIDFSAVLTFSNISLIFGIFLFKMVSCLLPALLYKLPLSDSLALSLVMSTRGVVDLTAFSFLRDAGDITQEAFPLLVAAIAITATFVQWMVKYLYDPSRKYAVYQKRNIIQSEKECKLAMLVCVHSSDNITALLRLLEAASPSTDNPIAVNALHLIEMRGRASTIFISHQVQSRRDSSYRSYSENVVFAFREFERSHSIFSVTVQAFTAISPRNLMYEDICSLALNTLASVIIIPFHRKWGFDGSIEAEDHSLRALNCSVLDKAPCSVGILIDRSHLGPSISGVMSSRISNVATIFIGGSDDREALAFCKCIGRNSEIKVTAIRLISEEGEEASGDGDISEVLDLEVLNDFRRNNIGQGNVKYVEKMVKYASETASLVCSAANEYDLIVVGRRYNLPSATTAGFEEWSEVPELGFIGDMLASADLKSRSSVLVLQQQRQLNQRYTKKWI